MTDKPLTTTEASPLAEASVFSNPASFEAAQRVAKMLQQSSLVPKQFQDSLPDCVIALEMAQRVGANVLAVMQNLYVIHGKPSWSSQFQISCVNTCGRFSPLRYEEKEIAGSDHCRAWAIDLKNEERLDGVWVSMKMAKEEKWLDKTGSKWKTMPQLMLRYRAAAFWTRQFAPELTLGMRTVEEQEDIGPEKEPVRLVIDDTPPVLTDEQKEELGKDIDQTRAAK